MGSLVIYGILMSKTWNWASHVFSLIRPFVSCLASVFALMLICFYPWPFSVFTGDSLPSSLCNNFFFWGGGGAFHRHHYRWNQCLHFFRRSRFRKCSGFLSRLYFLFSFLRIATKNKLKLCSEKQSWAQIRLLRNKRRKNRGGVIYFRWGMSWTRSELVRRKIIWWMQFYFFSAAGAISRTRARFQLLKKSFKKWNWFRHHVKLWPSN